MKKTINRDNETMREYWQRQLPAGYTFQNGKEYEDFEGLKFWQVVVLFILVFLPLLFAAYKHLF